MIFVKQIILLFYAFILTGCMSQKMLLTPERRTEHAIQLIKKKGWQEHQIQTSKFTLKAFGPKSAKKEKLLTIYIEGDGFAWITVNKASKNPTPIDAVALKMALEDHSSYPVVYLARPCQFVFNEAFKTCRLSDWTHARFSEEVIVSLNQAITYLKNYYHAKKLILIGYSGGGTVAALLAAKRQDVMHLITIAAILDTEQWTKISGLSPLYDSLNPASFKKNLMTVPQTHWIGNEDTVVSKEITFTFLKKFPKTIKTEIIVVPNFNHTCCWASTFISGSSSFSYRLKRLREEV